MQQYLIVGASGGIGKALALHLAGSGKQVIATYNKNKPDDESENIRYRHLDVLEEHLSPDFLPDELAGFAYCPGSIKLRPFERMKAEDFEADYKLQVMGAIRMLQLVMPRLKKSDNASVVLFSTVAVRTGLPFHTQVAVAKGAIEGLTRALAAEYAPHIRVNCIAPSLTDTPLAASLLNTEEKRTANAQRHPLKRIGTPADIAAMGAFLLSDRASWITGQVLYVDGGMSGIRT
ncbi:MAG: SDR family oxidoreductase [Bacteroidia bacterium]|nr:SDR family oxidoreductase [Bacteroidia bacterium]